MAAKKRVNVVNPEDVGSPAVPVDVLAQEIVKLSRGAQALLASRLNEDALLTLLSHQTRVPRKTCKVVLEGARDLAVKSLKGGGR